MAIPFWNILEQERLGQSYKGSLCIGAKHYTYTFRMLTSCPALEFPDIEVLRDTEIELADQAGEVILNSDQRIFLSEFLMQGIRDFCRLPAARAANTLHGTVEIFGRKLHTANRCVLAGEFPESETEAVCEFLTDLL